MQNEKFMLFSEYLKLGKKGEVDSFESRLLEFGIKINAIRYDYITSVLHNNPYNAINWENEIKNMAAKIGFALSKERPYHIPLLGYTKSGKTLFVKLIDAMLKKNKIRSYYINAKDFSIENEDINEYEFLLDNASKYKVIIVDDMWIAQDEVGKIKEILKNMKKGVVITVWKYLNYYELEDTILKDINTTLGEVRISALKQELCSDLFETIWTIIKYEDPAENEEKKDILKKSFCKIFEKSMGFAGIAIKLFVDLVNEFCIEGKGNKLDDFVENELKNYNFESIYNLKRDQVKMNIIKIILMSKDTRGATPTEIAEKIKKDSATITYHLSKLKIEKLVEDYRFGKNIFYRVKDIYAPFFEYVLLHQLNEMKEVVL